jgi:hypothetical protein
LLSCIHLGFFGTNILSSFFHPLPHGFGGPLSLFSNTCQEPWRQLRSGQQVPLARPHPALRQGLLDTGRPCTIPGAGHARGTVAGLTWAAVPLLHPDVAVVLGHAGLRVQKREAHAALRAQPRVVTPAVLNGFLVELVPEPARRQESEGVRPGQTGVSQRPPWKNCHEH